MTNQLEQNAPIGILGAGQLALMLHQAATQCGLRTHVYCQSSDEPAAQVAHEVFVGDWRNVAELEKFARSGIKWLLCEFENVPAESVEHNGDLGVPVHTLSALLKLAQRRISEKQLAQQLHIPTPRWAPFTIAADGSVYEHLNLKGWSESIIAKTNRLGYDGKGQERFATHEAFLEKRWKNAGTQYVLEERVDIDFECSVLVARNAGGEMVVSPAVRNTHTNQYGGGILLYSEWHEHIVSRDVEQEAQSYAEAIALRVDLVGVLCVEFFVTRNGLVLFNEMAPRPHNSFHGTIEGASVSQFDQCIAAVTGRPLLPMEFERPWVMLNLLGKNIQHIPQFKEAGWEAHNYGKTEVKVGRKMGHVTSVALNLAQQTQNLNFAHRLLMRSH